MRRHRRADKRSFLLVAPLVLATVAVLTADTSPLRPRRQASTPVRGPIAASAVAFATSLPATEIAAQAPNAAAPDHGAAPVRPLPQTRRANAIARGFDGALQSAAPPPLIPLPSVSFDGLSSQDDLTFFGGRLSPPDTNGDVGPNHYVQTVNVLVRVFSKAGAPLTAPFRMSTLFKNLSGLCASNDNGDPIVLYDPLADRWLLSQFAFNTSTFAPPYHQCIAISQTPDPTGTYFLYDFVMPNSNFNDYPHFGVWADAYYMSDNQFLNFGPFNGAGAFAFDRAKMLAGNPTAGFIYFDLGEAFGGMLPADVDGKTPPPAGAPAYFGMLQSATLALPGDTASTITDAMRLFAFHADFTTPASSTFTEIAGSPIPVAAFDPLNPDGRNDVEQPLPATSINNLDAIQDRLMHRLAYRNFGGTRESLVVSHTVNVGFDPSTPDGHQAAVRYYEFRRSLPAGTFTVPEQATFAPDADNRWMGSAAMDGQGNIAVGYTVSSATTFPSVRYAGRLASDAPNGLFQGEGILVTGTGVQRSTGGRWGDYSALSVDPADDCTFWYTNEYYTAASQLTSTVGWVTRIGTFRFPSCGAPTPQGVLTGVVRDLVTGAPIAGAVLTFSTQTPGSTGVVTDVNGVYRASVSPGTYAVTASAANHATQSVFGIAIADGSSATVNFGLALMPNKGLVTGVVRNATTGTPIANVLVASAGTSVRTDVNGRYTLNLGAGNLTVTATAAAFYMSGSVSVTVANQAVTLCDFALSLPPGSGLVTGHVRDASSGAPVPDVAVSAGGLTNTTADAGMYTLLLPAGSYTLTASRLDYLDASAAGVVVSNQLTAVRDLTIQAPALAPAAYDTTLKVPQCTGATAGCDSGTLLVGRDSLAGGAEPNQPNTINNSCADGNTGTFHVNESLDHLEVYTLDGGVFASGKKVRVQATVFAFSPSDRLDLYYSSTAANPTWTFLATFAPPGPGANTFSTTYALPAGSLQAIRGNYRFGGTADPCTLGSMDDRDDLVFGQASITGQVTDTLTGLPLPGATVTVAGGATAVTDANGKYFASADAGTYTVTASMTGHVSQATPGVVVTTGGSTTVNFSLALSANTGALTGSVREAASATAIAGAVVSAGGQQSTTSSSGTYLLFLPAGTYTVNASAADHIDQSFTGIAIGNQATTVRDFSLQSALASFDATLKAPRCTQTSGSCSSGALISGRDTIAGGAEPNQPNTILASCADGTLGFFHSDESIDLLRITSLDGTPIAPGKAVRVDATVWVFSPGVDKFELYSAPDATSPVWTRLTTITPTALGTQTFSVIFILPSGASTQAIRARYYDSNFTPASVPCGGSTTSYDDHDDLVFAVAPGSTIVTEPIVLSVDPTDEEQHAEGKWEDTPMHGGAEGAYAAFALQPARLTETVAAPMTSPGSTTPARGSSGALPVSPPALLPRPIPTTSMPIPASTRTSVVLSGTAAAPASGGTSSGGADGGASGAAAGSQDAPPQRAQAVPPAKKKPHRTMWEIEFVGGSVLASPASHGTSALPVAGTSFITASGSPSRVESSWYFGDGALLLNQVNAALGVTPRLTALDTALTTSMVQRQGGRAVGFRISRAVTPRVTAEFSLLSGGVPGVSKSSAAAIEASRASFLNAWTGLLAAGPFGTPNITSTVSTTSASSQRLVTLAAIIALRTKGKLVPYAAVGGGVNANLHTPTTTLSGQYRFSLGTLTSINETDTITIRHDAKKSAVGVAGGGVKYYLTPRFGIRLDARMFFGASGFDNLVDSKPGSVPSGQPGSIASVSVPAIQFGNSPPTGITSSLSGAALSGFRTFTSGVQHQTSITFGILLRF